MGVTNSKIKKYNAICKISVFNLRGFPHKTMAMGTVGDANAIVNVNMKKWRRKLNKKSNLLKNKSNVRNAKNIMLFLFTKIRKYARSV